MTEPLTRSETIDQFAAMNTGGVVGVAPVIRGRQCWLFLAHGPGGGLHFERDTRDRARLYRQALIERLTTQPGLCVVFSFADIEEYLSWLNAELNPPRHAKHQHHLQDPEGLVSVWRNWVWPYRRNRGEPADG